MAKAATTKASSASSTPAHSTSEQHQIIPLSDIYVDPRWNARSDLGEAEGGPDENTGLAGLRMSIGTKGQDTPVIVRPRYPHEKFRQPYFLVAGFRRTSVIGELAATNKDPKPTIKAFIRNVSEPEARELNIRENTARENLSGPDLAFGVAAMAASAEKMGMPIAQTSIGLALNLHQSYVGKMLAIAKIKGTYNDGEKGSKSTPILEHWRNSVSKATVEQLYRVSKVEDPEAQTKLYTSFVQGKKADARDPKVKLEQQIKTAAKWGRVLGILVHENAIDMQDDDAFFSTYLEKFMPIPEDMKQNEKNKLIGAAQDAFEQAAEHGEVKEEPKAEAVAPAKKGNSAKKVTAAATN